MRKRKIMLINISILILLIGLIITVIVLIVDKVGGDTEEHKKPRVITITIDEPVDINIPVEEREQIVYESLLAAGYSPAGACGMMGNIAVEAPDYDPRTVNESNGAFGLFQWNDVGDRQQHLKDFCEDNNMDCNTIEGQIAFAVYELSGADPIACRLDDLLKTTADPYTAAAEFTAGFERCICDSGKSADVYCGSLYPEFHKEHYQALAKRINKAMNYYIRFVRTPSADDGKQINITIN